jgi:hypothetical protein
MACGSSDTFSSMSPQLLSLEFSVALEYSDISYQSQLYDPFAEARYMTTLCGTLLS